MPKTVMLECWLHPFDFSRRGRAACGEILPSTGYVGTLDDDSVGLILGHEVLCHGPEEVY